MGPILSCRLLAGGVLRGGSLMGGLFLGGVLLAGCSQTQEGVLATVKISNPSGEARTEEVVEIPYENIAGKLGGETEFKVMDAAAGTEVPFQLEYRGREEPLNLLVQVSLEGNAELDLEIRKGAPDTVGSKTFARYVPERMDDFAWENDKIAFRMYGKALEGTSGDAHGIDVWVKRTDRLVIDKWYKSEDYHADNGDGLDYYKVGMTLGAGDIVPYINDSLYYSRHYRGHQVLDNGPLRTTFRLDYEEWDAGGTPVTVSKTISIDAGSQLSRFETEYAISGKDQIPVAIGIVQREEPGQLLTEKESGIMGYWEPEHGADGITGLGVIIRAPVSDITLAHGHLLGLAAAKNQEPLVYYNGAAWNKAGEINNAAAWFEYLKKFKERLDNPLVVSVE